MDNCQKLSSADQQIYQLCKKYGEESLEARRKFAGLLPEVFKRKIYEKKGFNSIFEFAAKLAGMSQDQVRLVLNLEKRFFDKPILRNILLSGEVSVNKLARVVTIATPENEEELASKLKLLSKNALAVFVKDEKLAMQESINFKNENDSPKPLFEDKSLPGQTSAPAKLNFQLTEENIAHLNKLHAQGHDVNQIIQEMLENREHQIQKTKVDIANTLPTKQSRYIPVKIKSILSQEYGKKCSIKSCPKPSKTYHHTQRFSISQNHNPQFLAPLCSEHHEISHSVDLQFHQFRNKSP